MQDGGLELGTGTPAVLSITFANNIDIFFCANISKIQFRFKLLRTFITSEEQSLQKQK